MERAVSLGGSAWRLLRQIEDRYGQRVALDDLCQCFATLEDAPAFTSSFFLAWHLARTIEEPSAEQRRERLRQIFSDFDPETEPVEEWLQSAEQTLIAALERNEQILADRGEDPLTPF